MDGLSRVVGASTFLELDGETYELSPLTVEDFGAIENHLLSMRRTPEAIAAELQKFSKFPAIQEKLIEQFYKDIRKDTGANKIPVADVQEWIDSIEGLIYTLWIGLRKKRPDFTIEQARKLFDRVGEQKIREKRDQASVLGMSGNSTGRSQIVDVVPADNHQLSLTGASSSAN